jgi:hypothetical protein
LIPELIEFGQDLLTIFWPAGVVPQRLKQS